MGFWFDTKKSRLVPSLITYALYMLLYIVTDERGYVVDAATTFV